MQQLEWLLLVYYLTMTRAGRRHHVWSHIQHTKNVETVKTVKIKTKSLEIYFALRASPVNIMTEEAPNI